MSDLYQTVHPDYVAGMRFVRRPRSERILRIALGEAGVRLQRLHESRVASATEFIFDLLKGHIRHYYLQEALQPSSPSIARIIESNYPGLYRHYTPHEMAAAISPSSFALAGYPGGLAQLAESQTTSDFPLLMGDVLDRMLLQRFAEKPQVWRQYISVGRPLRDFRLARMLTTDGGDGQWDKITEDEAVKYTNLTETGYTITPDLYGKGIRLSWRMLMNDDLDAFAEVPGVLARGGRRTISKFATDLLFDSNGPDATFVSAGNGNLITGNPALTVASLGTAIQQFAGFTDSEGEPILLEGVRLVHGPGLRITVQNIMNQLTIDMTEAGGTSARTVRVNNWIVSSLMPVEDPYIPIVATTNGNDSWLLVTDPNASRPAARVRFLSGFDTPRLYTKMPNTATVGGGLDEALGDFDSMSQSYKGLVAFGGTTMEPKAVLGSNGSGS